MSDLINWSAGSGEVRFDATCAECGSDRVVRSDIYDLSELESTSVWCDECGYSWWESL